MAPGRPPTRKLTYAGKTQSVAAWAQQLGHPSTQTIYTRLRRLDAAKRDPKDPLYAYEALFGHGGERAPGRPPKFSQLLELYGETKTLKEWAEFANVPVSSIRRRYYRQQLGAELTTHQVVFGGLPIGRPPTPEVQAVYVDPWHHDRHDRHSGESPKERFELHELQAPGERYLSNDELATFVRKLPNHLVGAWNRVGRPANHAEFIDRMYCSGRSAEYRLIAAEVILDANQHCGLQLDNTLKQRLQHLINTGGN
jgi:hypothetical protein